MRVAQDTKKDFAYDKSQGTWSWFDRSEKYHSESHHTGFTTFYEALEDAVEPYFQEEASVDSTV